jgi:hypothetical protein
VVSGNAPRTTASTQVRTSIGGGIAEFGFPEGERRLAGGEPVGVQRRQPRGWLLDDRRRPGGDPWHREGRFDHDQGRPTRVVPQAQGENLIAGGGGAFIGSGGPVSFTAGTFTGNFSAALGADGAIVACAR